MVEMGRNTIPGEVDDADEMLLLNGDVEGMLGAVELLMKGIGLEVVDPGKNEDDSCARAVPM